MVTMLLTHGQVFGMYLVSTSGTICLVDARSWSLISFQYPRSTSFSVHHIVTKLNDYTTSYIATYEVSAPHFLHCPSRLNGENFYKPDLLHIRLFIHQHHCLTNMHSRARVTFIQRMFISHSNLHPSLFNPHTKHTHPKNVNRHHRALRPCTHHSCDQQQCVRERRHPPSECIPPFFPGLRCCTRLHFPCFTQYFVSLNKTSKTN